MPVEHWNVADPSEAVRSDLILPEVERLFEIVVRADYGGTILNLLLEHLIHNFDPLDEKDAALVRVLAAAEALLIDSGVLSNDFTAIAARPLDAAREVAARGIAPPSRLRPLALSSPLGNPADLRKIEKLRTSSRPCTPRAAGSSCRPSVVSSAAAGNGERPLRPPWGLWVLLTLLAWGLFAADTGLYQDDANQLAVAQEAWKASGLAGLVAPAGTPTRRLLNIVFFLPWATGEPVLSLQLLTGLLWLGTGWAGWEVARALFPDESRAAWLAGTLTVCATSDFLSVSPVAAGYQASVLLGLCGLAAALRFLAGSPGWTLAVACAAACASVFIIDGATLALAMAPVLFLLYRGINRRSLVASAAWSLSLAPYALVFQAALNDPAGYLRTATYTLEWSGRFWRTLQLTARDVSPWEWPWVRPLFGELPPRVIPVWLWAAGAMISAAFVLGALRDLPVRPPVSTRRRDFLLAGWCAAAALATHAAWAGVAASSEFYRTHVLTRVLVSIVLGFLASRLLDRPGAPRVAALALLTVFTGLGVAGGLGRQDHFLSTWRRHRLELGSLVEAVPGVRPDTTLVLFVPHEPAYMATEVQYLAWRWSMLLWPDPAARPRVFLWSVDAQSACLAQDWGLRCRLPEEKACFESGACQGLSLRWREFVLLTWRKDEGRFRLEDEIPDGLLGGHPLPLGLYRPRDLVLPGPPDPRAARVLHGDVGLARLLP